jgi:predicted MPP superfamily phosphohydrolase
MRLWVLSDWHLDIFHGDFNPPRPEFDVLVVAGDVHDSIEQAIEFVRAVADDKPAIFVAGNHEFWSDRSAQTTLERGHAAAKRTGVRFLECSVTDIDGISFAGATLWTVDHPRFRSSAGYLAASGCDVAITHFEPPLAVINLVRPRLWVYGHHHGHGDRQIGGTRVVRNGGRHNYGLATDDAASDDFIVEIEAG